MLDKPGERVRDINSETHFTPCRHVELSTEQESCFPCDCDSSQMMTHLKMSERDYYQILQFL